MNHKILLGLATFAMMAPAFAQGTDSSAMKTQPVLTEATAPTGDGDKIVCKAMAPDTGTRIGGRRVCQRASAWEQQATDARQQLQAQQARGGHYGGPQ